MIQCLRFVIHEQKDIICRVKNKIKWDCNCKATENILKYKKVYGRYVPWVKKFKLN